MDSFWGSGLVCGDTCWGWLPHGVPGIRESGPAGGNTLGLRKERRQKTGAAGGHSERRAGRPCWPGGAGRGGEAQRSSVPAPRPGPAHVHTKKSIITFKMETNAPLFFGVLSVTRSCQFPMF